MTGKGLAMTTGGGGAEGVGAEAEEGEQRGDFGDASKVPGEASEEAAAAPKLAECHWREDRTWSCAYVPLRLRLTRHEAREACTEATRR